MAPLPLLLLATTLLFTAPLADSLSDADPPDLPLALVKLTFSNHLLDLLNVTIPAATLGTTRTLLIPPGETRTVFLEPQSPVLIPLVLRVLDVEYALDGGLLQRTIGRVSAETGLMEFVVSSPCEAREAYLSTLLLDPSVEVVAGATVQMASVCARPVSG